MKDELRLKIMNANEADTAGSCMALLDAIQSKRPEVQLLSLFAMMLEVSRVYQVDPKILYESVQNMWTDKTRVRDIFQTVRLIVDKELGKNAHLL